MDQRSPLRRITVQALRFPPPLVLYLFLLSLYVNLFLVLLKPLIAEDRTVANEGKPLQLLCALTGQTLQASSPPYLLSRRRRCMSFHYAPRI